MEFIIVENENKALLLENELIKKLEPKYNILLKDDKTFPHLAIDINSDFPCIRKHRGTKKDKNKYFGPFASATAVNSVIDILQKVFLLRSCRDGVFNNRERPCLLYQIKKCSAPCCNKISKLLPVFPETTFPLCFSSCPGQANTKAIFVSRFPELYSTISLQFIFCLISEE